MTTQTRVTTAAGFRNHLETMLGRTLTEAEAARVDTYRRAGFVLLVPAERYWPTERPAALTDEQKDAYLRGLLTLTDEQKADYLQGRAVLVDGEWVSKRDLGR